MDIVYIYGPPGVGKFTVGRELARLTGYRLFHNQLSIEFVRSVFDFGTPVFNKLVLKYRAEMIEEAAKGNISLIFTSAYARGLNDSIIKDIIRRVERNRGKVHLVQLRCDEDVLLKRIKNASRRSFYKIRSPKKLEELLRRYDHTSSIPFRKSLCVDNTRIAPKAAAMKIIGYYRLKHA